MSALARLAAFAAVLAVAFVVAFALGAALGPEFVEPPHGDVTPGVHGLAAH